MKDPRKINVRTRGFQARGFTPCQVEHHVWTKFTTPILHAIDNFKNYDVFFYIYITIDNIFV